MRWPVIRQVAGLMMLGVVLQVGAQTPNGFDSGSTFQGQQGGGARMGTQTPPADSQTRARSHTELAAEYYRQGNYSVALDEIRIALEAESNYVPAISVRGLVHLELREFDKADRDLKRALDLAPKDPAVMNNYGWFLCQSGKERQSLTYFLDAVKHPLYPTPELAYSNAGTCALKAGDLEGAESYLLQALRLSKDAALGTRTQLIQLSYRRGQYEAARRQVRDLMRRLDAPSAELILLSLKIERKLGDRVGEGEMAAMLRNRYPNSKEYQEFLKGNFE